MMKDQADTLRKWMQEDVETPKGVIFISEDPFMKKYQSWLDDIMEKLSSQGIQAIHYRLESTSEHEWCQMRKHFDFDQFKPILMIEGRGQFFSKWYPFMKRFEMDFMSVGILFFHLSERKANEHFKSFTGMMNKYLTINLFYLGSLNVKEKWSSLFRSIFNLIQWKREKRGERKSLEIKSKLDKWVKQVSQFVFDQGEVKNSEYE